MSAALGIDPGLDGALVLLGASLDVRAAHVMPTLGTRRRVLDLHALRGVLLDVWAAERGDLVVALERAGARPTDGKVSAWSNGCGWGQLDGLLCGLAIPVVVVPPRTWQARVCHGLPELDTKARTLLAVQRRVPDLDLTPGRRRVPHAGIADACGIALWALLDGPGR